MSQSSSKKLIAIIVVLAIVIAIPIFLFSRRSKLPDDQVTRMALMSMKGDLRGLIMAEEATKRIRGRYVSSPEDAGQISSPGVTVPVVVLTDSGWSATVQHKTISGLRCGVGVFTRNPIDRFAKSGEIVCE